MVGERIERIDGGEHTTEVEIFVMIYTIVMQGCKVSTSCTTNVPHGCAGLIKFSVNFKSHFPI